LGHLSNTESLNPLHQDAASSLFLFSARSVLDAKRHESQTSLTQIAFTGVRIFLLVVLRLMVASAILAVIVPAQAADGTVTAITNQSCAGTRAATNLGCTANDFSSNVTFDQASSSSITSCLAGTAISVDLLATVDSGAPDRYDAAYFFGQSGNSPALNNAANQCSIGVFPTSADPFTTFDADVCGDFRGSSPAATLLIQGVKLNCSNVAGTNQLAVPYTLVFSSQVGGSTCTSANVTASTGSKCQSGSSVLQSGGIAVSVNGYITLNKVTDPTGASGSFAFTTAASPTATVSPSTFSLSAGASQTVQVPLNGGATRSLTLSEGLLSGWDASTSIACTTPGGASASSYVTVNSATRTITATLTAANYGALCTMTNSKLPTVTLTKISNGGVGGFTFTGTNGWASQTITTAVSGTGVSGPAQTLTALSTATTVTETIPPGYKVTAISCTGYTGATAPAYDLTAGSAAIPASGTAAGANIACTMTNSKLPTVTLTKISNGGVGGFTFTGTNGWASQTITTAVSGTGVSGPAQTLTALSTATTITETIPPGYTLASATCSGLGSGGTYTTNTAAGSVAFDAAATSMGSNIACTFTNTYAAASVSIVKTQTSGPNPVTAAGQTISYSVTVSNGTGTAQTSVLLTDTLTQGASTLALTAGPVLGSGDANSNSTLDVGETWIYTASYTVPQSVIDNGATLSNIAAVDTDQIAPLASAAVTTAIAQSRSLLIAKSAKLNGNPVGLPITTALNAGDVISYSYLVTNDGNVTISGVAVSETAFTGTSVAPAPSGGATSLAPGANTTFSAIYTVTQTDIDLLQ
jgi:uncharacterized repeat protein (TIGR01451 family)